MKAYVDEDTCTGCGVCPTICPEVFETDATGIAHAYVEEVPPEVEEQCSDAADRCPVEAISLEEY
jgi:ferredoxin